MKSKFTHRFIMAFSLMLAIVSGTQPGMAQDEKPNKDKIEADSTKGTNQGSGISIGKSCQGFHRNYEYA